MRWSQQQKDQLLQLRAEGLTYGKIAERMNLTTGACSNMYEKLINPVKREESVRTKPVTSIVPEAGIAAAYGDSRYQDIGGV